MKITEVRLVKARTVNVGNYESVRIEFGIEATVNQEAGSPEAEARIKEVIDFVDRRLAAMCPPSSVTMSFFR
jgi:hypothetical protein